MDMYRRIADLSSLKITRICWTNGSTVTGTAGSGRDPGGYPYIRAAAGRQGSAASNSSISISVSIMMPTISRIEQSVENSL
jgi:hypothetical protein